MNKPSTLPSRFNQVTGSKRKSIGVQPDENTIRNIMQYSAALWTGKSKNGSFQHLIMN
jgi:hypothetical protein